MSKETKKTEAVEITVMDADALKQLPAPIKKDVMFFQDRLNGAELNVFNPLVSELLEIERKGKNTKMIAPDEEGNFDKANIQDFTDLKKDIRSYRASVKKIAKALKDPRNEENKKITSISNYFIDKATEIFENAEKEFDAYVQAEAEKAAERERKKNEEFLKATEEAQREAEEQRKKNEAFMAFTKQKEYFESEFASIAEQVKISNLQNLISLEESVSGIEYDPIAKERGWEEIEEVIKYVSVSRANLLAVISDKIKLAKLELEAQVRELKPDVAPSVSNVPVTASVPPAPPVAAPAFGFMIEGKDAYESIKARLKTLESGISDYLNNEPAQMKDSRIVKALDLITHILKYL